MKTIFIEWQRLIIDKETCPRCGATEEELNSAIKELERSGVKVRLTKKEIKMPEFSKSPQESNKILINGQPLEYWLNASTGKSQCCSVCGDNECRTVEVNDKIYETIPAELIVQAGKKASEKNG
ncbi:MAG: DUF2703 domain-containing protein [Candidatus Margulisiibacteriota bacterium]|nr:DUF2703 domain-containing protein [Candidatus Margulisiibacteriota bacterium]MBU1729599.1 DUF2703 domain-containing protein [Candidatus Margulisiibacteriota bacterium]MBU1956024.1 DUF2703 domain-containing protein [Candidatus Margulisiibacteriota bacterium]